MKIPWVFPHIELIAIELADTIDEEKCRRIEIDFPKHNHVGQVKNIIERKLKKTIGV